MKTSASLFSLYQKFDENDYCERNFQVFINFASDFVRTKKNHQKFVPFQFKADFLERLVDFLSKQDLV